MKAEEVALVSLEKLRKLQFDEIEAELSNRKEMCIRASTRGHGLIEEDRNQVAVEYGPFVYCMESPDVDVEYLEDLLMPLDPGFEPVEYEIEGRKIQALEGTMLQICLLYTSEKSRF